MYGSGRTRGERLEFISRGFAPFASIRPHPFRGRIEGLLGESSIHPLEVRKDWNLEP